MKILGINLGKKIKPLSITDVVPSGLGVRGMDAYGDYNFGYLNGGVIQHVFNGEKNKGDVGLIRDFIVDHNNLSRRVNETLLVNDVAKMLIKRYTKWIVSKGLELELDPNKVVLKHLGIDVDTEELNDLTEAFFDTWARSNESDYRGQKDFYTMQKTAFKASLSGNDCLTIVRYEKKTGVTVEIIDSQRLMNPLEASSDVNWRGGILNDERGKIIKFCVSSKNSKTGYVIIDAINKELNIQQAFLFKLDEHRPEDNRGLSVLSGSLDKLAKLDRYIEATVGAAEERAKIPMSIEHDVNSDGSNPMVNQLTKAFAGNPEQDSMPVDIVGNQLASRIAATSEKSVYNMPIGAKLKLHDAAVDKFSDVFIDSVINIVAGSIGIPPNVARMLYNDSFSASRAAINDWMHTIKVDRDAFNKGWLSPIFKFWFTVEAMRGTINAPAYLKALREENSYAIKAFLKCEFVGEMFPHIDPMKEVNAERAKLGPLFDNVPLTTHERATRQVGNTNSDAIIDQSEDELKKYTFFTKNVEDVTNNEKN